MPHFVTRGCQNFRPSVTFLIWTERFKPSLGVSRVNHWLSLAIRASCRTRSIDLPKNGYWHQYRYEHD